MPMSKSPLQIVNEKYGSKEKLVEELAGLVEKQADEEKADVVKRLGGVSNAKLLRLRERMNRFAEFRSQKSALIEMVVGNAKRDKDPGFKARVGQHTVGALLDIVERDERAQKREQAKKYKTTKKRSGEAAQAFSTLTRIKTQVPT
jgi:hypothetical protein